MMKPKKSVLLLLVSVLCTVQPSQDVVKNLTINFQKPLEACKQELDLTDDVTKEFANFWKEGYELTNRQTGCAIMCVAEKLELLNEGDLSLHHGRAKEFAMKHGADAAMAQQLMDILHGCATSTPPNVDSCLFTLNVSMCYKLKIHELDWAPDPDLIVAELLADT